LVQILGSSVNRKRVFEGGISMSRRALGLSAFLTFVLAMASAAPCLAISKEFNQTYPLQPGGSFELQNVNGTVDVQTWDRDGVD
jgi:hypothetical protein